MSRGDHGNVLVELALVMPLMVLILLMIIDAGLAVREHQVLQNAVREGARYSSLPGNLVSNLNPNASIDAIRQRVVDYCQQERVTIAGGDTITVDQHYPIAIGGLTVEGSMVTVTHTHTFLLAGAPLIPVGSLPLNASAVFRNMY